MIFEYTNTKVDRVVDGDTIDVTVEVDIGFKIATKYSMRVRIADIDTAEVYGVSKDSEEYAEGIQASNRVKQLIEGKLVRMVTRKTRKGNERQTFGRYVAEIYFRGSEGVEYSLADILKQEGYAKS